MMISCWGEVLGDFLGSEPINQNLDLKTKLRGAVSIRGP